MSKKKSNESKSKGRKQKQNLFQFTAAFLVVLAASYLIYFTFFKTESNTTRTNNLKNYTAFQFKKQGELSFTTAGQEFISQIDIEIAQDDESRAQGLMYRNKMDENQGMFFIFPREAHQSFWMRNTVLSLDIIFINKDNEIVKIHKNTEPFYEGSYPSGEPAIYVVEVNSGYTDRHNIKEGDKIVWRRL